LINAQNEQKEKERQAAVAHAEAEALMKKARDAKSRKAAKDAMDKEEAIKAEVAAAKLAT